MLHKLKLMVVSLLIILTLSTLITGCDLGAGCYVDEEPTASTSETTNSN